MQEKMIEVRADNGRWIILNTKDIKCVTFDRQLNDRSLFMVTLVYYGDEGVLELSGTYTEKECLVIKGALCGEIGTTPICSLTQAQDEIDRLSKSLLLIGEKAMCDFDDETVGQVDAAVKDRAKYKDWLAKILRPPTITPLRDIKGT